MIIQLQLVHNIKVKIDSIIKIQVFSFRVVLSQDIFLLPLLRMIDIMIQKLTSECFHRYFRPVGSKIFSFIFFLVRNLPRSIVLMSFDFFSFARYLHSLNKKLLYDKIYICANFLFLFLFLSFFYEIFLHVLSVV